MSTALLGHEIEALLPHFKKSRKSHHHSIAGSELRLSPGVDFIRSSTDCYYLFDIAALLYNSIDQDRIRINVRQMEDDSWIFSVDDWYTKDSLYTKTIPYLEFPLVSLSFWIIGGFALLPSEY